MSVTATARSVVDVVQKRNVTFLAASFAYYAFVSLFPLVLLAIAIGTLVGGQAFANALVTQAGRFLSQEGQTLLERTLQNTSGTGASVVGVVVLLWSSLKLFRGLVIAFEEVYETSPDVGIVEQVKKGLATLVAVVFGVALMVAIGAVLGTPLLAWIPFLDVAASFVLLLGLVFVFLPLYYVLPPIDVTLREALPGTLFAAVGWLVLQFGFQLFMSSSSKYGLGGIVGTIIVFLTWLYFAGILLLVGAVINVVVAGR
ncbi:YihY/virulence factor BrkB family protein [Haladaptatus salinisoli]|uniref:YihY/virulence factor BrkB family protein n=1 Tax=Haladaptatus salinisoli TaxID=2884876 RepID=UPI001D09F8A5|nr:YihY/virulence factor BrkB family protein [Haladaptatus salinisoli]